MSRHLPRRPHLDHLRKQAKHLLRDLRRREPGTKLADAQHVIAREYGFESWSKLKAHLESLPPDYGFDRYTPRARQALFFSRFEAGELGSASIEPEHVLLGLIRAGRGLRGRIFERVDCSLEDARSNVAAATSPRGPLPTSIVIPFSDTTKQALLSAALEAHRLVHHEVGIAHLLLGILRNERSLAASIAIEKGLPLQTVKDEIVHFLDEHPV